MAITLASLSPDSCVFVSDIDFHQYVLSASLINSHHRSTKRRIAYDLPTLFPRDFARSIFHRTRRIQCQRCLCVQKPTAEGARLPLAPPGTPSSQGAQMVG